LDRTSIYNALKERRCYATTGARIILDFTVNGNSMGAMITCAEKEPRIIQSKVMGTEKIKYVELLKNGEVIFRQQPSKPEENLTFTFEDKSLISAGSYYYTRLMQADGHQAWAIPIWIDII